MPVRALVLTGFGINCDAETHTAFVRAGAAADRVHLNDLIRAPDRLLDYQILAAPGGFSFGDDVASGKIFANRLRFKLGNELKRFADDGRLVIGICNGFQVLVKMGLLPRLGRGFAQEVTLTHNDSDRFENRWVRLTTDGRTRCVWTEGIERIELPVRHGEGKLVPRNEAVLERLRANGQVVLRYATETGNPANGRFPANPNGSIDDIAGLCDPTGRIFGIMPHPEAFLERTNHPRWTREILPEPGAGQAIFSNAVRWVQDNLN